MKIKLIILFCLVLLGQMAWAQTQVKGTVYDETGTPLPGATVIEKGTTNGVVTNIDGVYTISVAGGATLQIAFVGYTTQDIPVAGKTIIDINLEPDTKQISDVVVVGYGTQKRAKLTGAVTDVSGADLRQSGLSNVTHMIQDMLPGVMTEIQSGQPGADDAKITVRGISTFSDNSPLILVDGIVAAGGFSQIDPGEIASISVLKDASETAIYGVLGANGVILVTTRRGNKGKPRITVANEVTAKTLVDLPDQLSSYDVLMLGQEANKNANNYNGVRAMWYVNKFNDPDRDMELYPDVDWYDALMRDVGWENKTRMNVSGGTDFVKYFAQISYDYQGDIIKNLNSNGYYDPQFTFNKINFRTNLDFNLSKTTVLKTDISGRTELKKTPNVGVDPGDFGNVFKHINAATPFLFPLYYSEEFLQNHPDPLDPNAGMRLASAMREQPYQANAYNDLYYSGMRKYRKDVLDFQVGLEQDLKFITPGLKAFARINYSTNFRYRKTEGRDRMEWLYDGERDKWYIESANKHYNTSPLDFHSSGGEDYEGNNRNIYYEGILTYNRTFGVNTFNFTGVFSRHEKHSSVGSLPYYHEDWVGRLVYDYDDKYIVKFSAGYNGSEKFAPGKRFGFFPSGALAWNAHKEDFIADNLSFIKQLKVRFGMGKTGHESGARFMYEGGWLGANSRLGYYRFGDPMSSELIRYAEFKIANPNATWETAISQNLGFDLAVLNGDLSFNVDIYKEHRSNIFITQPVGSFYHPSFGQRISKYGANIGLPAINAGETKNHGVEFVTKYSHTFANGITFSAGGYCNYADNRIIYKADAAGKPEYQKQVGKPIDYNLGYQTAGYINTFEEAINAPDVNGGANPGDYFYSDFNANGRIESDDNIPQGTRQPLFSYGFNMGGNYKNFKVAVRFFGKGNAHYTTSKYYPNFEEYLLEAKTVHLDRWTPENTDATFPAFENTGTRFYQSRADVNILNASYLKLQSVTIGYTLRSDYLKKLLRIENMQFNLSGQNLASWSDLPFGDPEAANSVGAGYGNYPLVSRYIFGVNINF